MNVWRVAHEFQQISQGGGMTYPQEIACETRCGPPFRAWASPCRTALGAQYLSVSTRRVTDFCTLHPMIYSLRCSRLPGLISPPIPTVFIQKNAITLARANRGPL
jgi:hypothetical protein